MMCNSELESDYVGAPTQVTGTASELVLLNVQ